ncbi:uncharacterized protein [Dermacentor albipictus]|uniref:uncharacterized protein n=1 Tax=Dermacentor albipictus TaxID=60249 RepID=UPI0038FCCFAB
MADYPRAGEFDAPAYDLRRGGSAPRPSLPPRPSTIPLGYPLQQIPQQKGAAGTLALQQQQREPSPSYGAPQANSFGRPPAATGAGTAFRAGPGTLPPLRGDAMTTDNISYEEHRGHSGTSFFEKKVSIFKAWQLFIMWMAVCGLIVYIASYVGFRHMLKPNATEKNSPIRASPEPVFLGRPCGTKRPCKDPAICVQDVCVCRNGSRAVNHVCVPAEEERISVEWDVTNDMPPSNVEENTEIPYNEVPAATIPSMSPVVPTSFDEELPTSLTQDTAQ